MDREQWLGLADDSLVTEWSLLECSAFLLIIRGVVEVVKLEEAKEGCRVTDDSSGVVVHCTATSTV